MTDRTYFPFSAIVDQADMKDALRCTAVYPEIGGVLISGTRGTAKSTAARSLANLLPDIRAVADCPFHCPPDEPENQCERCAQRDFEDDSSAIETIRTPFVNLPIGATEDRVLGTIDLETAIQEGERSFEPGLLAQANRGILYIDEVNLLSDHLVDVLLDAVATGTNRVEREGVSVKHPANVMLVGTMNPEEGELRPQLLDRFGLFVDMDRGMDPADRKAVVRRRTRFDDHPFEMMAEWRDQEADLAEAIVEARARVTDVEIPDELLDRIVEVCVDHGVDGLRADIIIHRTSRALAALDGYQEVREEHVTRAAELALGHRSRSTSSPDSGGPNPPNTTGDDRDQADDPPDKPAPAELPDLETDQAPSDGADGPEEPSNGVEGDEDDGMTGSAADETFPISPGVAPSLTRPPVQGDRPDSVGPGGRSPAGPSDRHGAHVGARRPAGRPADLALTATVRAAAPHQPARSTDPRSDLAVALRPSDIRVKRRQARTRNLVVFVVDSSGSMGAYERMSAVKGAVLSLLEDAYQHRHQVSLVGFRGEGAETLLPPTRSMRRAARQLADMPTGGRTPLAAGLERGLDIVARERTRGSDLEPLLVLLTDGRSNETGPATDPVRAALQRASRVRANDIPAVCFDTETGPVRLGLVRVLADRMGAEYYRFDDLDPGGISEAVLDMVDGSDRVGG